MDTFLQAEERAAGAVFAESDGCTLPEIFSEVPAEYRAAREKAAIFDTNWHATFSLTGTDRVRYLNAVVSGNVQALEEGAGTLALLLNSQGRILAELEIYRLPEQLLVRTHGSARDRARETLEKYIIMDDVELADATDSVGSFAIEGPFAGEILQEVCGVQIGGLSALSIREIRVGELQFNLVFKSHFGFPGAEFLAAPETLRALWTRLMAAVKAKGGKPIGMQAVNILRLEAGIPWFPADFNENVIPHEAALEETHISFGKGCYTGQEIVERVRSRGHVNRRRVRLKFSRNEPPEFGARLFSDGKEIGLVTSAAYSPQAGSAIGMGYVRKEHTAPGSIFEVNGGSAAVV
jgi:folate-binding protein YgfZ